MPTSRPGEAVRQSGSRYVLVGVDDGPSSVAAARYAARAAQDRGADLLIAHADGERDAPRQDTFRGPVTGTVPDRVLTQVIVPPSLNVRCLSEVADPVELLVRLGAAAELTVVGQHHAIPPGHLLGGSTAAGLAAMATGPVVTVPAYYHRDAHPRAPVVVALDGTAAADLVLKLAFDEAAFRQVPLLVLHATPDSTSPSRQDELEVDLAEILAGWKSDRPEVVVQTVVLAGEAEDRILQASRHAALVIVGRPHLAAVGGWLRSVARAVLDRSGCPLAVVTSPRTRLHEAHAQSRAAPS